MVFISLDKEVIVGAALAEFCGLGELAEYGRAELKDNELAYSF
jgi:hypothetical protein